MLSKELLKRSLFMLKTFLLKRDRDISGVSGCGIIAEGCLFESGEVALHWFGEHGSINIYHSLEDLKFVHSHGDCTKIIFNDPETDLKSSPRNN